MSEKLKTLEEDQMNYGFPGPPVQAVWNALPQLVAVVEAAEEIAAETPHADEGYEDYEIHLALAALDAALGESA